MSAVTQIVGVGVDFAVPQFAGHVPPSVHCFAVQKDAYADASFNNDEHAALMMLRATKPAFRLQAGMLIMLKENRVVESTARSS